MKIADFFVALGFDVKGDKQLDVMDQRLKKAEIGAIGLLAGVTALNVAFYAMVNSAAQAAVSLNKFALSTGLSADELQRWQYAGKLANVQADEIADAFKAIQNAQTKLRLTGEGAAPFQFFGLSVNQSVPDLLKRLHQTIQTGDVGANRLMASQLGISENVFQFLRQSNLGLGEYNNKLTLQTDKLVTLNRAWQSVVASIDMVKNRFAETFAGPLTMVIRLLKLVVEVMGDFVVWLGKATPLATAMRWALFGLVLVMGALFLALTGIVAVLGAAIAAMKILTIASIPILVPLLAIIAVLAGMAAAVVYLIAIFQDFWTQLDGGKSHWDWNKNLIFTIKNVERLAGALQWVLDNWKKVAAITALFNPGAGLSMLTDEKRITNSIKGLPANFQQTNDINIHVNGARDPAVTGRQVGISLNRSISDASRQVPLASP